MRAFIFLLVICLASTRASPATLESDSDECRKVPKVELKEECRTEDVRMEQSYLVQECEDVFVSHCEENEEDSSELDVVTPEHSNSASDNEGDDKKPTFSHFPHRTTDEVDDVNGDAKQSFSHFPHRSSPTSVVPAKHSLSKREEVEPSEDEDEGSEVEDCMQKKIKHCQNIPQWKTIPSEICENRNITVYVDECDSNSETEEIITSSNASEGSPIVGEHGTGASGYLIIVLSSLLILIGGVFLALWLLSLKMGISFLATIKHILEPLRKGLNYARFA